MSYRSGEAISGYFTLLYLRLIHGLKESSSHELMNDPQMMVWVTSVWENVCNNSKNVERILDFEKKLKTFKNVCRTNDQANSDRTQTTTLSFKYGSVHRWELNYQTDIYCCDHSVKLWAHFEHWGLNFCVYVFDMSIQKTLKTRWHLWKWNTFLTLCSWILNSSHIKFEIDKNCWWQVKK